MFPHADAGTSHSFYYGDRHQCGRHLRRQEAMPLQRHATMPLRRHAAMALREQVAMPLHRPAATPFQRHAATRLLCNRNVSTNNAYSSSSSSSGSSGSSNSNNSNSSNSSSASDDEDTQMLVRRSHRRTKSGRSEYRTNSYTGRGHNRTAKRRSNDSRGDRANSGDRHDNESNGDRPNGGGEDQSNNAAPRLGQKKRPGKETHTSDERTPVYVVNEVADNLPPTKSKSSVDRASPALNRLRPRSSSTTRSLATDVLPLPLRKRKNAVETRDVQVESDGNVSNPADLLSSATSTEDADSPRGMPRGTHGQTSVDRLQAKAVTRFPFSLGTLRSGRQRRVYLLYIGGLFTLSLLLLYIFLWRLTINQTKSSLSILFEDINDLLCIV